MVENNSNSNLNGQVDGHNDQMEPEEAETEPVLVKTK